jgi:hypothetical protein
MNREYTLDSLQNAGQEPRKSFESLALEGLHSRGTIAVGPGYREEKQRRLYERLKKTGSP